MSSSNINALNTAERCIQQIRAIINEVESGQIKSESGFVHEISPQNLSDLRLLFTRQKTDLIKEINSIKLKP